MISNSEAPGIASVCGITLALSNAAHAPYLPAGDGRFPVGNRPRPIRISGIAEQFRINRIRNQFRDFVNDALFVCVRNGDREPVLRESGESRGAGSACVLFVLWCADGQCKPGSSRPPGCIAPALHSDCTALHSGGKPLHSMLHRSALCVALRIARLALRLGEDEVRIVALLHASRRGQFVLRVVKRAA